MGRKKTTEEFKKEVFNLVGNEYEVKSEYVNNKEHVQMLHTSCGNIYGVSPVNFLRGYKCPYCSKRRKMDNGLFIKEIERIHNGKLEILNEYINNKTYVNVRCKVCNHTYEARPNNLMQGYGCKSCAGNLPLTIDIVKERVKEIEGDKYKVLSKTYINNKEKLLFKHTECGNTFKMNFSDFYSANNRCPFCSDGNNSKGVQRIRKYLKDNKYKYIEQKKFKNCINPKTGFNLRFDFFVKINDDLKVLIEYDGEQHFLESSARGNLEQIQYLDKLKDEYCKKYNRILIRIPYTKLRRLEEFLEDQIDREVQRLSKPRH